MTEFLDLIDEKYLQLPGMPFRPVDFSRTLGYFTLDVITDIAFGFPAGCVKANADVFDFFSNVAAFVPVMSLTAVVPSLLKITGIPWINKMLAPSSADRVGIGKIMGFVTNTFSGALADFRNQFGQNCGRETIFRHRI